MWWKISDRRRKIRWFRIRIIKNDERDHIENSESLRRIYIQQNRNNNDLVNTYIEVDANVVKNTELITSESLAWKITDTPDENFDTEEAISFDNLNIPVDCSDYDILEEEICIYPKMMRLG